MPVEFFVLCRVRLPRRDPGWTLAIGPVQLNEGAAPPMAPVVDAVASISFGSRAAASDVPFKMASELARLVQGVVVDEVGEVHADFAASVEAPISAANVEARLREVWDRHQALQGRAHTKAVERFEADLASDPLVREGNDWSDL
ncbi:MAG: hypothetical protein JNJ54_02185 [Myxococcaceae bacterium]|nr:hypothetical protein [Myxococcaceae bacterium]